MRIIAALFMFGVVTFVAAWLTVLPMVGLFYIFGWLR
jgi:hypothetical protein